MEEDFDDIDPIDYDSLLSIDSYEKAERYVRSSMTNATTLQIEGIIKAIYRVSGRDIAQISRERLSPPPVQKGGNRQDATFYKLMAFLDTIHDFAESDTDIEQFISEFGVELPDELRPEVIHNEKAVVTILSNKKLLHFGSREVVNPLYDARILETFDIEAAFNNDSEMTLENLFHMQHRSLIGKLSSGVWQPLITMDVITTTSVIPGREAPYQVLKLKQIAHLIGIMRMIYGPIREFQVDCTNQHLIMLICALDWVSQALLKHFITDPPFVNIADVKTKLKVLITEVDVAVSWTVRYSDANLFDAAINTTHRLAYDERPTGPVFASHIPYQITLRGIRQEPHNQTYVDATFTDVDKVSTDFAIRNKEASLTFSLNVLRFLTTTTTRLPSNSVAPGLRDYVASRSKPLMYAIKRAGDWGQVEHCKKYNKVFVTCDKMAALYAWYRKVPFIFMRTQKHEGTMTERGVPDFFSYSFAMRPGH